ncbi:hypothetical protein D3C76_376920 [compost metagenome]
MIASIIGIDGCIVVRFCDLLQIAVLVVGQGGLLLQRIHRFNDPVQCIVVVGRHCSEGIGFVQQVAGGIVGIRSGAALCILHFRQAAQRIIRKCRFVLIGVHDLLYIAFGIIDVGGFIPERITHQCIPSQSIVFIRCLLSRRIQEFGHQSAVIAGYCSFLIQRVNGSRIQTPAVVFGCPDRVVRVNHCNLIAVLVILVFGYRTKCIGYLHQLSERIIIIVGAVTQRIRLFDGIADRIITVTRLGSERIGYTQQLVALAVGICGDISFCILLGEHVSVIVVGICARLAFSIRYFLQLANIVVAVSSNCSGFVLLFYDTSKHIIGLAGAVLKRVRCAAQTVHLIIADRLISSFVCVFHRITVRIVGNAACLVQRISNRNRTVFLVIVDGLQLAFRIRELSCPVQGIAFNDCRISAGVLDFLGESVGIVGVGSSVSFGIRNGDRNPCTVSGNGDDAAEGICTFEQIACCIIFIGRAVA